jgi:uncharacterized membrane protein YdjX (TVP38/TMEM64 family)
VVNLAAGASHLSLRDFTLGTLFGMAPGILAMTLLGYRLKLAVVDPGWKSVLTLLALAAGVLIAGALVHRRLGRGAMGELDAATES